LRQGTLRRPGSTRRATYGQAIGILMQCDTLYRFPGDVGNATTFPFPVRYKEVHGMPGTFLQEPDAAASLGPFVDGARELEREGVAAIVAGCGFFARFQGELSRAVEIPVFTSSLLQVPVVHCALGRRRTIGIITANTRALTEECFEATGWSSTRIPLAIAGLDQQPEALELLRGDDLSTAARSRLAGLLAEMAVDLVTHNPAVGAIVLECTNLPPFAAAIQDAVGLPVFDVVTLTTLAHEAVTRHPYVGHL
jgi:Asp/Glu/hydantoin racemase